MSRPRWICISKGTLSNSRWLLCRVDMSNRTTIWSGRILSGVAVLFLAFDSLMKIARAAPAVEGTIKLGYSPDSLVTIGILEAICLVLYLYRRTAVLGAVLLTGFL